MGFWQSPLDWLYSWRLRQSPLCPLFIRPLATDLGARNISHLTCTLGASNIPHLHRAAAHSKDSSSSHAQRTGGSLVSVQLVSVRFSSAHTTQTDRQTGSLGCPSICGTPCVTPALSVVSRRLEGEGDEGDNVEDEVLEIRS